MKPLRVLFLLLLLGCVPADPDGSASSTETPAAAQEGPFVASTRGQVYYRSGCAAAQRLSPTYRRSFPSAAAAEAAGYRPSTAPGCGSDAAPPSTAQGETRGSAPASPRTSAPAATTPCVVASVSDGDTLTCRDKTRVRLLLIDAPETAQRPYGTQARDALRRLAPVGAEVRLERDVQPRDRYERTLAYVWLPNGRMANEEMARQGYAVSLTYPPNVRHVERIRSAVEEAKRGRRGLWSTSAFECSPRDFRAGRCG